MSQDVNEDWANRDFIESVEVCVRKCVDFLNHFQESAQYRLSVVDQRLSSLERKLDFLEAQLLNCDPSQRDAAQKPFTGSIFDPTKRAEIVRQNLERRKQPQKYTKKAIAPRNLKLAAQQRREELLQQQEMQRKRAAQQKAAEEEAKRQAAQQEAQRRQQEEERKRAEQQAAAQRAKAEAEAKKQAAIAEQQRQAQAAAAAQGPPPSPAAGRPPPSPVAKQPPPQPGPPASPVQQQRPPPQPIPSQHQPPPPQPKPPQAPGGAYGEGQREGEGEGEGEGGIFPHGDPSRIDIQTIVQGTGRTPTPESQVEIQYNGFLPNGKQFISHQEVIQLGKKQNIKGLEMACCSMNEGTRAKLWIPSKLAYGSRGAGQLIPPNSDLTFDITLIRVVQM